MNTENLADEEEVTPAVTEQTSTEVEQDPLKTELEKVQRKGRTKAEKLQYTKRRVEEQLKELGIDDEPVDDEDDKPVTVGMLKKLQAQTATKTALDLANEVPAEVERELIRYHLENTIRSSGNPTEDFKLAQSLVNAVKNQQITEEVLRKPVTKSHPSIGQPAKVAKPEEDFTQEELSYMRPPFNLTKTQILEARKKAETK